MTKKVKLAVFGNDLRCEVKKYPLSDNGEQIKVISGGEGHFMPRFDTESYLEFPNKFLFWRIGWSRLYFAKNKAKNCVNFKTEEVFGPDLEQLKTSLAATNLDKLGKQEPPFPIWIIYLILLLVLGTTAKVFGVI